MFVEFHSSKNCVLIARNLEFWLLFKVEEQKGRSCKGSFRKHLFEFGVILSCAKNLEDLTKKKEEKKL